MRESAVFVWEDRALFIGDRSETAIHRHHAIELAIALDDDGLCMANDEGLTFDGACGVLVRSNAKHRLSIPGPKVAVLYVDPFSGLGAPLHEWLDEAPMAGLPHALLTELRPSFRRLFDEDAGLLAARRATDALLREVADGEPSEATKGWVDPRIRRALRWIDGRLDAPPRQAEVAAEVGLSPSRFGHLFKAQVGMPMRRYMLWMRLRAALTEAMAGGDMTQAAHQAGFADSAHFTRTCKRMFGLPPTAFAPVDAAFVA